jgi:hypothetical protein
LGGGGCFCWGFWKKWCADGGFFVVRSWWICGGLWCVDALVFGVEDFPWVLGLFFGLVWKRTFGEVCW